VKLVVATRNPGKVREIHEILSAYPEFEVIGLAETGLPESPAEDEVEGFPTFQENALAKARYYAARVGLPVLADDSGICVDALNGAPGVHSRRFAAAHLERGETQDAANNAHLLELLDELPAEARGAEYACAVAYVAPAGDEFVVEGRCRGRILQAPRGTGGFGYDPLFYLDAEGCTFGELPPDRKHWVSHRGIAVRFAAERLLAGLGDGSP
jgi:XTP/dITP diphosphohydrolase